MTTIRDKAIDYVHQQLNIAVTPHGFITEVVDALLTDRELLLLLAGQNPNAAPPCAEPSGMHRKDRPDFLCQRGRGHGGEHEVILTNGAYMTWEDK